MAAMTSRAIAIAPDRSVALDVGAAPASPPALRRIWKMALRDLTNR
jgi:hypothetical protein